jgi:hypothetical protein
LCSSNGNIFVVDFIGSLGYWNWQIGQFFFWQVHSCWCICALRISIGKNVWSVVIYLSIIFSVVSFDEMPNWRALWTHNNPWSWANPPLWNSVAKNNLEFHQIIH